LKELVGKLEKLLEKVGLLRLVLLFLASMSVLPLLISYVLPAFDHSNPLKNLQDLTVIVVGFLAFATKLPVAGPWDYLFAGVLILFLRKYKAAALVAVSGFAWIYTWMFLGGQLMEFGTRQTVAPFFRIVAMSTYCGNTLALVILSYMLPSIVAFQRKKKNRWRYFWVTLLLTPIPAVWPVTLFYAFRDDKDPNAKPPAGTAEKIAASKKRRKKK
jgi:hypothetical protein